MAGTSRFFSDEKGLKGKEHRDGPLGDAMSDLRADLGRAFDIVDRESAQQAITDPGDAGAIPVTKSGVCALTSGAGGETRTLAAPTYIGQRLMLCHDTDGGGAIALTVAAAFNEAGNNTLTFDDAGESALLMGITIGGTLTWKATALDGATPSTV